MERRIIQFVKDSTEKPDNFFIIQVTENASWNIHQYDLRCLLICIAEKFIYSSIKWTESILTTTALNLTGISFN